MTAERTSHLQVEDNDEKHICHISFNWIIRKREMRHLVSLLGGEWPITWWFSRAWVLLIVYKDSLLQWPVNYIHYPELDGKLTPGEKYLQGNIRVRLLSRDCIYTGVKSVLVCVLGIVCFQLFLISQSCRLTIAAILLKYDWFQYKSTTLLLNI